MTLRDSLFRHKKVTVTRKEKSWQTYKQPQRQPHFSKICLGDDERTRWLLGRNFL